MLELDEEIRAFIDAGAAPVTLDEVLAHKAVHGKAPGTVRGIAPKRRTLLAAFTVAAVVVALLIGLVVEWPGEPARSKPAMTASTILTNAALVADNERPLVPGPGQYLYVRVIDGSTEGTAFTPGKRLSRFYVQEMFQTWTAPHGQPVKEGLVVGQPLFVTTADRVAWEDAGSPPIYSGYGGGGTPPYYDVADLPTKADRMKAYLAKQGSLPVSPSYGRDALWEFDAAVDFLQAGASSQQRAALLRFMADIPGVRSVGPQTSMGTGLRGQGLELRSDHPGAEVLAIIDPKTSKMLELRGVVTNAAMFQEIPSDADVNSGHAIAPWQNGQAYSYTDFLYAGIANRAGHAPSAAPTAPPGWSWATPRSPLPGSAYP